MHGLTIYDRELHFENSKFDLYVYFPVLGEYLMTLLDHEERERLKHTCKITVCLR